MHRDYYIVQDGANFDVFDDKDCEQFYMHQTAPFPVSDWDCAAAEKARSWFKIRLTGHTLHFL